ncbi:MAG: type II secretion system F family protein [Planctomycetota bacterium]
MAGRGADDSKIIRLWQDARQTHGMIQGEAALTFKEKLERIANDAGWQIPLQTILLGLGGFAVLTFTILLTLSGSILLAIAGLLVVVCSFWAYTNSRIDKRATLFEKQLVDALGIAARSLRAGHPLTGSFQLISEEIGPPLGDVFYRVYQEQALGLDMQNSIRTIARVTGNPELKLFATAVAIQLQSGGNLADLMDSLSAVIRARIRLSRRVRILTAQAKLSARVLILMPIILFFMLNIINPDYMEPLYETTIGRYLLTITIASVILGWWVMRKLSELKY